YFLNAGTALVAGFMHQAVAGDGNFDDKAVQANAAVGSTTISLTNGATTLAKDELENGYVLFYTAGTPSTLLGCYPIKANQLEVAGSATYKISLEGSEGLVTAIDTSDKYSVIHNLWYKVVTWANNAAPTARVVGASVRIVTASYYGFLQTRGICNLLCDDGAAFDPGDSVTGGAIGSATDGYKDNSLSSNDYDIEIVGTSCNVGSTDDGAFVFLKIE
ncbi:hypothetical protein LCGC14_3043170, partial [marine sediment metagenome]